MYKQKTSYIFVILNNSDRHDKHTARKFTVDIYINHISELFIFPSWL